MHIVCLDLEGVLTPEVWVAVATRFKDERLRLTTRDIPDYDRLMRYRLKILRERGIRLRDIQAVIRRLKPLPGAVAFLNALRATHQVIILSDTYYEFAGPFLAQLGHPTLWCHWLRTDRDGMIADYCLRMRNSKRHAVQSLKRLGFSVVAAGDSYNDLAMLQAADRGIWFRPPPTIRKAYPQFPVATSHRQLLRSCQQPLPPHRRASGR